MKRVDKDNRDSILKDFNVMVKWLLGYTVLNIGFWSALLVLFVIYIFTIVPYGVPGEMFIYDLDRMFIDLKNVVVLGFKIIFWSIFIIILFPIVLIFMGLGASLK